MRGNPAVKQTTIKMDLTGLDKMVEQLGRTYVTRVGILGSKNARSGKSGGDMTNAELGMIHELGSETANIPPRSFLVMPLELKKGELMSVFQTGAMKAALDNGDIKKAHQLLGLKAEEIVQQAFSTGGFGQWPALKPATVAHKGSSAILIDQGELRRAQTSDVVKRSDV
jgi:phage gpG-like protein